MDATRLQQIKETVKDQQQFAERIMDGGDNYDGADGARVVLGLTHLFDELIAEIEKK